MQNIAIAIITVLIMAAFGPASAAPLRARTVQASNPAVSFDACRALAAQRGDRLFSSVKGYRAFLDQCMNRTIR
jgi:hypothetical protein